MPSLSSRVISWTRARRRALASRAVPSTYTYHDDHGAIEYNAQTSETDCWRQGRSKAACRNTWWQNTDASSTYHSTVGPTAALTVTFQGTSVKLMGHTESSFAQALVSIDGGAETSVSFQPNLTKSDLTQPLWTSPALDESKTHVLKLTYQPKSGQTDDQSNLISVRSFVVESTLGQLPSVSPSSDKNRQVVSVVAGLSGAFMLLLAIAAFAWYWTRYRRDRPHDVRLVSATNSSIGVPPMTQPMRSFTASPWTPPATSGYEGDRSSPPGGHAGKFGSMSSTDHLLPLATDRNQRSHYAFDADHEPAAVPTASSMDVDVLRSRLTITPTHSVLRIPGRRGNTSPTNTSSYESWTSSDFGPIPDPFIADGPVLPSVPPRALQHQLGRHGSSPLAHGDQKRRSDIYEKEELVTSAQVAGPSRKSSSQKSTLPPPYSVTFD